jgi:RNA polymerase sigma factor (sigma-70 family)
MEDRRFPATAGDDRLAAIVEAKWDAVYRVCFARLSRREDAEDATQETFVRFLRTDPRRINNVDAWLTAVAVRVCGGVHRRRYSHPEVLLDLHSAASPGAEDFDAVLDNVWLERVAKDLSAGDREVLTLLYLYPHRRQEVAAHLGVTLDHLRVIAFRARRHAQAVLDSIAELDPFG